MKIIPKRNMEEGNRAMTKWNLKTHIPGKVYDLTQENMNAMIGDVERLTRPVSKSTDFEKARDEAAELNGGCEYETGQFLNGADWAYEWCKGDLKIRCQQLAESQQDMFNAHMSLDKALCENHELTKKLAVAKEALFVIDDRLDEAMHYSHDQNAVENELRDAIKTTKKALAEIEGE